MKLFYAILFLIYLPGQSVQPQINFNPFNPNNNLIIPKIPPKTEFCGERVPVENADVYERFERELIVINYWHAQTILIIKRAARWFPVIEPILKANGIPDDFKYLCAIESNLENVASGVGATGFWQFMDYTAKEYNLEVNKEVDERFNVQKSTEAACKYLKKGFDLLGNWALVAAAYNYGLNGIQNQVKLQKASNYYNLVLPLETTRYVFRILAMREVLNNPAKFGFNIAPEETYKPYQFTEVKVSSTIEDLADFALEQKINYKTLKIFNPWLRFHKLTIKNKTYYLKIPKEGTFKILP